MGTNKFNINILYRITFLLISQMLFSQKLVPDFITNNQINPSGTAVTYFVSDVNGKVLVLNDLKNKKEYRLKNIHPNLILDDEYFIGIDYSGKKLFKIGLTTPQLDSLGGIDGFSWLAATRTLLTFNRSKKELMLYNVKEGRANSFKNVVTYSADQGSGNIVFSDTSHATHFLKMKTNTLKTFNNKNSSYILKKMIWDKKGEDMFTFFYNKDSLKVYRTSEKAHNLVFSHSLYLNEHMMLDTLFNQVKLLNDERIAVGIKRRNALEPLTNQPEIWLGADKGITPVNEQRKIGNIQLGVIDLKRSLLTDLSAAGKLLDFKISGKDDEVYFYEMSLNDDFSRIDPEITVFKYNKGLTQAQCLGIFNGAGQHILSSKHSSLLFYFKDNHWHYYDPKKNISVNFTESLNDIFYETESEIHKITDMPINQHLLLYQNKYFVFNGKKSLWLFDISKRKMNEIDTNLNKNYIISRDCFSLNDIPWGWHPEFVLNDNVILLYNSDDYKIEGISILNKQGEIIDLLEVQGKIKEIKQSKRKITYIIEKANQPPTLYLLDLDTNKETVIFESNKVDSLAKNVRKEYHTWLNDKHEKRGAVVTFPSNYDTAKKYPAIFDIYEKRKQKQHLYVSPFMIDGNGINSRAYSDDGYFVVQPDIYYKIGDPGVSAAECVLEALDKVLQYYAIDPDRVGLFGHSYGGYQTNFILTRTNRFKTAVSSSGVADIISSYFTFSPEYNTPDMFRYETQQFRIGGGFYDMKENYIENSPLFYAKNITTPLLLITGNKDYVVNWTQSVTMFLALKRLKKDVNMILYPNEGHVLMKKDNKIDASNKMKDWFDFYLKNRDKPHWMKEGLQ